MSKEPDQQMKPHPTRWQYPLVTYLTIYYGDGFYTLKSNEFKFLLNNSEPVRQTNTQNVFHFLTGKQHKARNSSLMDLKYLWFAADVITY